MSNFPGPFELRIHYTVIYDSVTVDHEQRLSCDIVGDPDPGLDFDLYNYRSKDGSTYDIDTWVDAWVALLAVVMHEFSTFVDVELWKYTTGTFDAAFYSSKSLAVAGDSATVAVPCGQIIWTFRTQAGSNLRVNLMESIKNSQPTLPIPSGDSDLDDIAAAVIADDSPVFGRDNSYAFNGIHTLRGQNEALFKKRYRP